MKSISQGTVDPPHQVGHEEHGALQHSHQQRLAAVVVARDLFAQLGDPRLQRVLLDQRLRDQPFRVEGGRGRRSCAHRIPRRSGEAEPGRDRARPPGRRPARDARPRLAASDSCSSLPVSSLGKPQRPPGRALGRLAQHQHAQRAGQLAEAVEVEGSSTYPAGQLGAAARPARPAARPSGPGCCSAPGCTRASAGSTSWRIRFRRMAVSSLLASSPRLDPVVTRTRPGCRPRSGTAAGGPGRRFAGASPGWRAGPTTRPAGRAPSRPGR